MIHPVLAPGTVADDGGRHGRLRPLVEASIGHHLQELLQVPDVVIDLKQGLQGSLVGADVGVDLRTLLRLLVVEQVLEVRSVQPKKVLLATHTSSNGQLVQRSRAPRTRPPT